MKKIIISSLTAHKYFPIFLFVISLLLSFGAFAFRDFFSQARGFGLLGLFLINFLSSATFFISGPAFLTVIAGGSIYPPLLVALVAAIGACAGDLVSFAFGYSSRHVALRKLEKQKWFGRLEKSFKHYGVLILFAFAFFPNPVFDAVGLLAGIFKYNWMKFFTIILIGRFARFILVALIGAKFY